MTLRIMANKAISHLQLAILLFGLSAVSTGCVRRRLTVRTNPTGAMVYIDHQPIGRSPVSHSITYYGTRHFEIVRRPGRRRVRGLPGTGRIDLEQRLIGEQLALVASPPINSQDEAEHNHHDDTHDQFLFVQLNPGQKLVKALRLRRFRIHTRREMFGWAIKKASLKSGIPRAALVK